MKFELLVAIRYLKAKRKQAVISLITFISILGVAAGVAALIIALAVESGFSQELQEKLLGAQAHVTILPKDRDGITDYLKVTHEIEGVDGVVAAAPAVYSTVLLSNDIKSQGVVLKGIVPDMESRMSDLARNMVKGSLKALDAENGQSIVLGQELSTSFGAFPGDAVRVFSGTFHNTPAGPEPKMLGFTVAGIFSSGLYDYDSGWVYVSMDAAQRLTGVGDVASLIEVKVRDIDQATQIGQKIVATLGPRFAFTDWKSMNKSIFQALRLEKVVMFLTIGLIVLVAALNIVATLIMMVLEKTRDIAILMSMGATQENIRRIFILQGVIIGVVGTGAGVVLGQSVSYIADKYRLISLAPDVYTLAYVPFHAQPWDTVIVAAAAILISFLATIYPSATASKLHPVEALRYE